MTSPKVLWASDAPMMHSAYANQTRNTLIWINDDYDIRVDQAPLCMPSQGSFGEGFPWPWEVRVAETAANGTQFNGKVLRQNFYDGDYDFMVCLKDALAWLPNWHRDPIPKVLYTPLSSDPAPPTVFANAEKWQRIWCPSRNAVDQFEDHGHDARYVPHHLDKETFHPVGREDDDLTKTDVKEQLGFDPDHFVVGHVGLNKGPRKDIARLVEAFADLWDDHPNARLHLHTNKRGEGSGGQPIAPIVDKLDLPPGVVKCTNLWRYKKGYTAKEMATWYNHLDCYLGPTRGEGFGVPLLEAAACGVPIIGTDFTAMRERVHEGENGYLASVAATAENSLGGTQAIPDTDSIAWCLEQVHDQTWDPAAVRATVVPEYDSATVIDDHVAPALHDMYDACYTTREVTA